MVGCSCRFVVDLVKDYSDIVVAFNVVDGSHSVFELFWVIDLLFDSLRLLNDFLIFFSPYVNVMV